MRKIFWDRDNIGLLGDRLHAAPHAHCVAQVFLGLEEPLRVVVDSRRVEGDCIVVMPNVPHAFCCENALYFSLLAEPASGLGKALVWGCSAGYRVYRAPADEIRQGAASLLGPADMTGYAAFVDRFAAYLGLKKREPVTDERIAGLLAMLRDCDCYDHTAETLARRVSLSPGRLSHLFREQVGISLKRYISFHQLEKACAALLDGKSVTEAAMMTGFDSPSHFAATVKKWMGMPVTDWTKDSVFLKAF